MDQAHQPFFLLRRKTSDSTPQPGCSNHAPGDCLAMLEPPVIRRRFQRMPQSVAKVQHHAHACLPLIGRHHVGFDSDSIHNDVPDGCLFAIYDGIQPAFPNRQVAVRNGWLRI